MPWIKAVARLFPPLATKQTQQTSHTLAGVKIPVPGVFCNSMWSLKVPTPLQQQEWVGHISSHLQPTPAIHERLIMHRLVRRYRLGQATFLCVTS